MNIIVWEWELAPTLLVPYSPEVSRFLESSFKTNKDIVDLGQADHNLSCYEVSLKNMTQIRLETGTSRDIRRTLYPSSHLCSSGIVWEWYSDYNTWTAYDMDTAQRLEREHIKGGYLDLENTPIGIPYIVDFYKKIQINKYSGFERSIQRRQCTASYPSDIGQSSHSNKTSSLTAGLSPLSSHSLVHSSSLKTASGPTSLSSKKSQVLQALSSKMSGLVSPSKQTKTQSHTKQQSSYGAGATGGTSFGDENDKMSRSRTSEFKSPSKQRDLPLTKTQSHAKQALSYSAGATGGTSFGDENKSHENKRKKVKLNDPLASFCRDVKESTDQECSICFEKLKDVSGFHDDSSKPPDSDIKELRKCKHRFHGTCLLEFIKSASKNGWIQCPTCKAIHGVKHGHQPKEGTMDVSKNHQSLPGHHGHGMIVITYNFRTGIQDKEHPHPGKLYYASGFPRICYLPDNKKGQKVLGLLKKAWDRRLIFTVATSNTTGQDDTVVWNEIHHKTEAFSNISGHGFPDSNYLDNVLAELAVQGVDDSDDDEV